MKLNEAFDIRRGDVVSLIGAGGKTTTLVMLGTELREQGWRVLATTTTRLAAGQIDLFPVALPYTSSPAQLSDALSEYGFVLVTGDMIGDRMQAPPHEWFGHILDRVDSDVLLIEADGARQLPFKAPYTHEPVIVDETNVVVLVAGMNALKQPLNDDSIYNASTMIDTYGFYPDHRMRLSWMADVLINPEMGLKGIPPHARTLLYINQVINHSYWRGRARWLATRVVQSRAVDRVVYGNTRHNEPAREVYRSVAAVVLAAGQASRMGCPKVLLPWENGMTVLEQIIYQLSLASIDPISVVTGYYDDQMRPLLKRLDVTRVRNSRYKQGDMLSSLQAGLRALSGDVAAALIVLGDQPRIELGVLNRLIRAYAEGRGQIIAPSYDHRRGHPILVDRRYWPEFLALEPHQAPRDVINAHQDAIHYVNVHSDSVLKDIDTPQDYYQARRDAGLKPLSVDPIRLSRQAEGG